MWNTVTKKKKKKNKGSIRADWEESGSESEHEGEQLGPGQYLQDFHASTFGSEPILHDHPQKFGSIVRRFRDPLRDKNQGKPGPGQYLSQNVLPKFVPRKGKDETSNFLAPARKDFTVLRDHAEQPGP